MNDIELHRVDAMPDPEAMPASIRHALGFLLTRLLSQAPALLHAEWDRAQPQVTWHLRPREPKREGADAVLATIPAGLFSSMLARLAVNVAIDHTTGGCGTGTIAFEGRRYPCVIFLSKCAATGYWVRMYAAAAAAPG